MAEVVLASDFLSRFPAFSGVPGEQLAAHLADANATFDERSFSNAVTYRRAVMLLAAHHLSNAQSSTQPLLPGLSLDNIQSVSDSGVSISLRESGSAYGATAYGRELSKLIRSSAVFGTVGVRYTTTHVTHVQLPLPLPLPNPDPGFVVISDDPQNIIEQRDDGLFAAPKLTSSQW